MSVRLFVGTAMLSMIGLVGCQAANPIVRGQTPCGAGGPSAQGNGPMPGPFYFDGPSGYGPAGLNGMGAGNGAGGYGSGGAGGYGQGGQCQNHNHPYGAKCPNCAPDNFWRPQHHHTFSYEQPKNMVYPPQNQPAGAVVYPYYTCKGPSDFFLK